MKTLYMIRGLPGSGKTTLANELKETYEAAGFTVALASADDYHVVNGEYQWKAENIARAHHACKTKAGSAMSLGVDVVIVHNTSTTEKELKVYLEFAQLFGYKVVSLVVENRHGNESIHNVPEETIDAMRRRFSVKL